MKTLISLTCLMVMAAAGWYLYSERQKVVAQNRVDEFRANVAAQEAERQLRTARLNPSECFLLAQRAIETKSAENIDDLNFCDSIGNIDASTRQKLDFAGVF